MRAPEPVVLAGYGVRLEPLGLRHAPDLLVASEDPAVWPTVQEAVGEAVGDVGG